MWNQWIYDFTFLFYTWISNVRKLLCRATKALQKGKIIPRGGIFVVGEEQDTYGGEFTPKESFYGDLSQLNIWKHELTADDIYDLARSCHHAIGDVVAWSDFASQTLGNVLRIAPSLACDCKFISSKIIDWEKWCWPTKNNEWKEIKRKYL